jgi:zinc transporter 2
MHSNPRKKSQDHDHQDHGHEGHNHGHGGCSHGHHIKAFENINIQAAYIHIISDIILSIGVIVSASVIYFVAGNDTKWTAWQLADPFCTYLFSIVALFSTVSILKESMVLLMDGCENPDLLVATDEFVRTLKKEHPKI